jgi:hypothetical protein
MSEHDLPLKQASNDWSTSILCVFLGFTLGFLCCHLVYEGMNHDPIQGIIDDYKD